LEYLTLKSHLASFWKLTFVAAALLVAIGCASIYTGHAGAIRLKVVDARTGDPLPGVSAMWREDLDDLLVGHFQTGPTNLQASDNSGIITINLAHPKMTGRVTLSCVGYTTVYGIYSDGSLETSDNIQPTPIPQDIFTLDDAQAAGMSGNSFLVRMHK
jgi:hypothetical protein